VFEKVAVAYQWLCQRSLRATDGPDRHNMLLLLQAQTIVFERYGAELEPFKYPGYPQLLHTVRLETEDGQLFSKSTSLLGAGAALAYQVFFAFFECANCGLMMTGRVLQTVRCSALNAEELRREGGLEALLEAVTRCVPMIGQSSTSQDVAVEVCAHAARCMAVAARFPACRDRLAEQKVSKPFVNSHDHDCPFVNSHPYDCRVASHRCAARDFLYVDFLFQYGSIEAMTS